MADQPRRDGGIATLLVDDEELVRPVIARGLRHAGHEVTETGSAEEALERLVDADRPFDLLVTDVRLPGMDGIELARRARALLPGLRVLLVSGSPDVPTGGGDAGHPLLLKPFRRPELIAAVDQVLGRSR